MRGCRRGAARFRCVLQGAVIAATLLAGLGCGRFFLDDGVSRMPAVAAADGFGASPSTAAVWVAQVSPIAMAIVGKAFDGGNSRDARAASLRMLSDPLPLYSVSDGSLFDPTSAVSGLDVVRVGNEGYFVVWIERGGPMRGLFTDLDLVPLGPQILILPGTPDPPPAQEQIVLTAAYVDFRDRVVVFYGLSDQVCYSVIEASSGAVLNGFCLPDPAGWFDVARRRGGPNQPPFMVSFLHPVSPTDGSAGPFEVRSSFVTFDSEAMDLLVLCRATVTASPSSDLNAVAGSPHVDSNLWYVVWDERDGDVFGAFVHDDCTVGSEAPLGSRLIESTTGQQPPRSYFPMDVRFESDTGDGLVALKQAVPDNSLSGGVTYVVSVIPLDFDGSTMVPAPLRPIGIATRASLPRVNRSFQLGWDYDGFKLVFDEVEVQPDRAPLPSTWRVIFNALDAKGSTIAP